MTAQLERGGEPRVIDADGGPIAALRSGDAGATPVLLLPGYTGSKEDFAPLLARLATAGFHVTAIDLPGQFESSGPADPAEYTPDALAAVVRSVAASIGPRIHLLGHSFGGLVARAAVIAAPDAFASLVLMCSGPAGIAGARADMITRLEPVLAASGLAGVYAASLTMYRAQAGYVEPAAPLAAFLERRFVTGVPAMLQGMGQALRAEPDRVAELAAVAPPTLVMYGVDDDAWPPAVQHEMADRLAAARVVIPKAAHSPAVENPTATTSALVDFWQRV
ncbi:MAG TPA: alpha/beta fold hydrolase [Jatrophihabitantaceae bacterium]|jgi:pimeloyl-ACP methyl ester carboxylesterase|nr:alpha/beta fold hydrolase [Jatrophihabitantaceae bacterium]